LHSSSAAEAFDPVETERLLLRRPTLDDLDDVYRIHGNPETWTHSPDSTHAGRGESEADLRRWLAHWADHGFGYWTVLHDGVVIGFGGLWLMPGWQGRDVLNVYYRFDPSAWGKGYATEMVRTAADLARAELPGLPLVARIRPSNAESARVAERAGFARRPDLDSEGFHVFALEPS
jgi:[ribosomal protein S5]-alanine N-acetyltransferase